MDNDHSSTLRAVADTAVLLFIAEQNYQRALRTVVRASFSYARASKKHAAAIENAGGPRRGSDYVRNGLYSTLNGREQLKDDVQSAYDWAEANRNS